MASYRTYHHIKREVVRAHGARGNHDDEDGENHQESMMGGGSNTLGGNIGGIRGAPSTVFGGT